MPLERLAANPLLTPGDLRPTSDDLKVLCVFNPGAVRVGRETILLVRVGEAPRDEPGTVATVAFDAQAGRVRVHRIRRDDPDLEPGDNRGFLYKGRALLTSLSHLRVARSTDGVHFAFDPAPAIFPTTPYEAHGCEDPRITCLDGRYYVAYTAVSERGITVMLAVTDDFRRFQKRGVIFPPTNKDVCLFPQRVRGRYVCRHRPEGTHRNPASIWTAYSPDLVSWGGHELTLTPTPGTWEGGRVGCGAPPVRTPEGWLEVYHAADERGRYGLGAMLSDLDRPERILARSRRPLLLPEAPYETRGVYGNAVFCCGMTADDAGRLTIYYGAADTTCAAAATTLADLIAATNP
jgi:predicted GH43/DUF377 family glycosyl hydrolase